MCTLAAVIVMVGIGPGNEASRFVPEHAVNSVYVGVLEQGLEANGVTVKLPAPRLRDGQSADSERAALREVAGTDQKLNELVRNSVTAPHLIKVHDVKAAGATIRIIDLWFVVHADIAEIDPARQAEQADNKDVEAGNMAILTRLLKPDDVRAAGIDPPKDTRGSGPITWYAHIHGRLLDRIAFEATNKVMASRTEDSIVVAARTDPAFDRPGPNGNGWKAVATGDANDAAGGALRPYRGGISYTRISRLAFQPGALLVEMHGAFAEPHDWFQGAPILRSKFSVVAQDQVRKLRRELARRRS